MWAHDKVGLFVNSTYISTIWNKLVPYRMFCRWWNIIICTTVHPMKPVCVCERERWRERERGGYYAVLILIGKAYWNMLVPQHPILLHNHMIVMLNESNLPVYTCNDSDQNELAQSDTMYYTITHSDSCSKTTENRSITYHAHRKSCNWPNGTEISEISELR